MFSKPVIVVLWILSLIIAACVPFFTGTLRSKESKTNPASLSLKNETNACLKEIVGEKGAASAVIVKALIQLRSNQEEQERRECNISSVNSGAYLKPVGRS
jgi:hypothetical protein